MTERRNVLVTGGAGGIGAARCAAFTSTWRPIVADLAYGPSKAARRQGVRVDAVSPGPVRTPVIEASYARGERGPEAMARQTALGRVITPVELAGPIEFLLSDAASAITGANLFVDAGAMAALGWNLFGGVDAVLDGLALHPQPASGSVA